MSKLYGGRLTTCHPIRSLYERHTQGSVWESQNRRIFIKAAVRSVSLKDLLIRIYACSFYDTAGSPDQRARYELASLKLRCAACPHCEEQ